MSISMKRVMGRKPPAVSIKRDYYAMASVDGDCAEIMMYGDIVDTQPMDWWTGEPIEGQYIIESEFLKDLNLLAACKAITIRMNSLGGDVGTSLLIHNRLRELAAKGMNLICIVDGVAMSGGSLIMCACDTVRVNPSSLVMIHKCWTLIWGGYNADELREQATQNDAWDQAQVAIYKRKCRLSEAVINGMMADTTYMTGREAVEKGFADELLEDAEPLNIAASADGRSLFVRGRKMQLIPGMFVPDNIPTVTSVASATVTTNKRQPDKTGKQEGGQKPMANTLEELRTEYPELTAQLEAEVKAAAVPAVATPAAPVAMTHPVPPVTPPAPSAGADDPAKIERKRIQDIDALAPMYDVDTVQAAKYGDNACTAQEMAYRAAQKAAQQGRTILGNLESDTATSGVREIGAAASVGGDGKPLTPQQLMAQGRADAKSLNKTDKEET